MNIYLAGPMRADPDGCEAKFAYATKRLRADGHTVFSPAEFMDVMPGLETNEQLRDVFAVDTNWICKKADAVALLPGWEHSLGATMEYDLAMALGLTIIILGDDYVT